MRFTGLKKYLPGDREKSTGVIIERDWREGKPVPACERRTTIKQTYV
jgi:hypothetical protein